jgi:hypothetical protein
MQQAAAVGMTRRDWITELHGLGVLGGLRSLWWHCLLDETSCSFINSGQALDEQGVDGGP